MKIFKNQKKTNFSKLDKKVMSSQEHVAFDFSSKIVDFVVTRKLALLVLCEEEFVAIDLSLPKWPTHRLPYLSPIHSRNAFFAVFSRLAKASSDLIFAA